MQISSSLQQIMVPCRALKLQIVALPVTGGLRWPQVHAAPGAGGVRVHCSAAAAQLDAAGAARPRPRRAPHECAAQCRAHAERRAHFNPVRLSLFVTSLNILSACCCKPCKPWPTTSALRLRGCRAPGGLSSSTLLLNTQSCFNLSKVCTVGEQLM